VTDREDVEQVAVEEGGFTDLNAFLAAVERRAFLMARVALGNDDDALDSVQDAMLVMVRK
jgi:RNA polymerase sigma-70 factor (ECF subfamily)